MEKESLSLANICGGAADEVFQREMQEVVRNMVDVNTDAEAAREITLKFTIKPFGDRTGAEVRFRCISKTAPVQDVKGSFYLERSGTTVVAMPRNPRQARMFEKSPDSSLTQ